MAWTLWNWKPPTTFLWNWESLPSLLQEEEQTSHLAQEHRCLPAELGRALRQLTAQTQQGIAAHHQGSQEGEQEGSGEMRGLLAWQS